MADCKVRLGTCVCACTGLRDLPCDAMSGIFCDHYFCDSLYQRLQLFDYEASAVTAQRARALGARGAHFARKRPQFTARRARASERAPRR